MIYCTIPDFARIHGAGGGRSRETDHFSFLPSKLWYDSVPIFFQSTAKVYSNPFILQFRTTILIITKSTKFLAKNNCVFTLNVT